MNVKPSRTGRRWALTSVFAAMALAMVLGLGTSPPPAAAFGGLTDEAILVWQHRTPGAPDYDIWYSALGRPSPSDPTAALTWHAAGGPVPQAAPIATFPGDDKNAHVSTNAGIAIAVWQHAPGTGPAPGEWDIYWSQLNTGTGLWSPPAEIAHVHGDDYDPNVTVDSNGNAVAVWVHKHDDGTREIFYSVKTGSTWTPPAPIGPPAPGDASLPEISITAVAGGGPLQHKVVAVWADQVAFMVHQMFYSVFDGTSWTPPAPIPVPAPEIPDVGHSHYLGSDPDPFGAAGRDGITADALGNAYVMWGGGPIREGHGSVGVVGAIYDVAADTWAPMLTPFGGRLIGIGGCENPDIAMTTGTGDLVGVFNFAGFIEHTFRTGGAFTPESFSYDSELVDERPTDAGLSETELVAANWGADSFSGGPGPLSDIIYGIGTVTPGVSVTFGGAAHVVPGGLPGQDAFPEIASFFAGAIIEPGLSLSPASDTNPVGTPHTVTATVTADGEPQPGVSVHFEVTGTGSTPFPSMGDCVTGPDGTCTFTYTSPTEGDDLITATAIIEGQEVMATATKKWVALQVELQGRMTGGAFIDDPVAGRVSWGFSVHCTPAELPNRLQVSWNDMDGHNSFHMEEMLTGTCSDDPTIDPGDPPAPFDTHTGEGIGRFNGQPGHATWIFKDAGEPGGGTDRVELHVDELLTGKHITVVGFIKRGNHQAHPSGGA